MALAVAALHIAAAIKEARGDRPAPAGADGLILLGTFTELEEGRAVTVHVNGERIAVVRKNGALWAISNVCPHQNGPLGEGVVRDGYLECPWHGYQFDPCTGLGPAGLLRLCADVQARNHWQPDLSEALSALVRRPRSAPALAVAREGA